MSILIENVTKHFGKNVVLDGINLEIKTGSLVALLGGSGSGKSTLLRVVAGFEEPTTGRVWLNGKDSNNLSIQEKEIGFVFQAYALFEHLTVYENIAFGLSCTSSFFEGKLSNTLLINSFSYSSTFILTLLSSCHHTLKNVIDKKKQNLGNFFSKAERPQEKNISLKRENLKKKAKKLKGISFEEPQKSSFKEDSIPSSLSSENPITNPFRLYHSVSNQKKKEVGLMPIESTRHINHINAFSNGNLRSVEELLRLVGLEELAHRYPNQLSGGQCQRVALARALAVQPKVLLLDEPFGALDTKVRKNLRRWLRQLHERVGVTTLFVTHDHQEAMEVANEIVVLEKGRVKHSLNSPQKIFSRLITVSSI